jgi:AAA domain-containing protein
MRSSSLAASPSGNRFTMYRAISRSSRLLQLAEVFPLLAWQIIRCDHGEAKQLVEAGAKVNTIASLMNVPMAFRGLKPGAFHFEGIQRGQAHMSGMAETIKFHNERRLAFTAFADLDERPRKDWLVKDFLGVGEMSAIFGAPGTGKSALAGDLGAHVAAGLHWFGRPVSRGAVLYIAAERAALVKRRMAAWRLYHGVKDIPLGIVSKTIDLRSSRKDADSVIECCAELQQKFEHDPRLVIIDTVSRVLTGGDENAPRDMGI